MNNVELREFEVSALSDAEVLQKIGGKLKELRLEQNIKQKELAEKSGLSMFSISQMETGHNTSVQSVVQVLRALGRLDVVAHLLSREGEIATSTKQRVSRVVVPSEEDGSNTHRQVSYSMPEDNGWGMAAEDVPWEDEIR